MPPRTRSASAAAAAAATAAFDNTDVRKLIFEYRKLSCIEVCAKKKFDKVVKIINLAVDEFDDVRVNLYLGRPWSGFAAWFFAGLF